MTRLPFTLFVYTCCFKALEKGQVIMLKRSFVLPSMNTLSCHINNPTRCKKDEQGNTSCTLSNSYNHQQMNILFFVFLTWKNWRCQSHGQQGQALESSASVSAIRLTVDSVKRPASSQRWCTARLPVAIFKIKMTMANILPHFAHERGHQLCALFLDMQFFSNSRI